MAFTDAEYGKFQLTNDRPIPNDAEYGRFQLKNDRPITDDAEYGRFFLKITTEGVWGPPATKLPFKAVKNSYVTSYSLTGSNNYFTFEMVGETSPRMFWAIDWSKYQNIAFIAKVEELVLPSTTTDTSGFGLMAVDRSTQIMKFLGVLQRTGTNTLFSHWSGSQVFDYTGATGWSSDYLTTTIQSTPFWIGLKYSGGVMRHFERVDENSNWTAKHTKTHSFTTATDDIGIGFHSNAVSPSDTYRITLSHVRIGELLGI